MLKYTILSIFFTSTLFACGCTDPMNATKGEKEVNNNYLRKDGEFANSIEKINTNFKGMLKIEYESLDSIKEIDKTVRVDLIHLQEIVFEVTKRNQLLFNKEEL